MRKQTCVLQRKLKGAFLLTSKDLSIVKIIDVKVGMKFCQLSDI